MRRCPLGFILAPLLWAAPAAAGAPTLADRLAELGWSPTPPLEMGLEPGDAYRMGDRGLQLFYRRCLDSPIASMSLAGVPGAEELEGWLAVEAAAPGLPQPQVRLGTLVMLGLAEEDAQARADCADAVEAVVLQGRDPGQIFVVTEMVVGEVVELRCLRPGRRGRPMGGDQVQAQPSCRPLALGQSVSAHRGRPVAELLAERPAPAERSWPAGAVGRAELEARLGPARALSSPALERAHGRALVDWPAVGVRARLEGGQLRSISFGEAGEAALQGLLPPGRWAGLMGGVEPELRRRLGEPVHWGDGWYTPEVARWQAWTWGAVDDQVEEGLLVGYSAEGLVVQVEWWLPRSPRWPRDDMMPVRLDRGTEGQ